MKTILSTTTQLLAAIALLASCQSELNETDAQPNGDAIVRIAATASSPLTRSNPLGDDQVSTTFNPGDQIAVSAGTQPEIIYTLAPDGITWNPEDGKHHLWEGRTMQFTAYYPVSRTFEDRSIAGSIVSTANTFKLPALQFGLDYHDYGLHWADRMHFSGTLTHNGDGVTSIALRRQTARVQVTIAKIDPRIDMGKADIYCQYISQHSEIPDNNVSTLITPFRGAGAVEGTTVTGLVLPGSGDSEKNFIQVTIYPEGAFQNGYNLNVLGIPALEAGKSYDYQLTVTPSRLIVNSTKITDWTSVDAGSEDVNQTPN